MRRYLPAVALLLASSLLSLGLAEWLLRSFFTAAPQLLLDIYRKDTDGRLLLRPDIELRHISRYWDVLIETDAHGHRRLHDPAVNRPGAATVLVLGDSQAFGFGVEAQDSFPALLGQAMNDVRVVNASVPGSGPLDHLRLAPLELERFHPRLVLEAVFVGNDFADVSFGGADQLEIDDGLLVRRPAPGEYRPPAGLTHLLRRSHVLQLLRAVQFSLLRGSDSGPPRTWDAWMREYSSVHLAHPPPRVEESFRQTVDVLGQTAAAVRRTGARFVLLVIPRSFQVYPAERKQMLAALGWDEGDLDLDRPQRILAEWAASAGVPVVDLLPRFRGHAENPSNPPLYYTPNAHLRALGHRLIAEQAEPLLVDLLRAAPIR